MSGSPDRDRAPVRPFQIAADEAGGYRLTVRETRFNSQNFPVVTATPVAETFATAAAARAFAKAHYGAETGDFVLPPRRK